MSEILRAIIRPFLECRKLQEEGLRPNYAVEYGYEDLEVPGKVGTSGLLSGYPILRHGRGLHQCPNQTKAHSRHRMSTGWRCP